MRVAISRALIACNWGSAAAARLVSRLDASCRCAAKLHASITSSSGRSSCTRSSAAAPRASSSRGECAPAVVKAQARSLSSPGVASRTLALAAEPMRVQNVLHGGCALIPHAAAPCAVLASCRGAKVGSSRSVCSRTIAMAAGESCTHALCASLVRASAPRRTHSAPQCTALNAAPCCSRTPTSALAEGADVIIDVSFRGGGLPGIHDRVPGAHSSSTFVDQ